MASEDTDGRRFDAVRMTREIRDKLYEQHGGSFDKLLRLLGGNAASAQEGTAAVEEQAAEET